MKEPQDQLWDATFQADQTRVWHQTCRSLLHAKSQEGKGPATCPRANSLAKYPSTTSGWSWADRQLVQALLQRRTWLWPIRTPVRKPSISAPAHTRFEWEWRATYHLYLLSEVYESLKPMEEGMASQSGMLDKWFAICRSDLQRALILEAHEKWNQANLWNSNKVAIINLIFDCRQMKTSP